MNARIKELRIELKMTQEAFGNHIGLKRNSIAQIELGTRTPSNQVIVSICREFNVNENWLRTGEGAMLRERSRNDELAAFFGDLLKSEPDFRHRLISVLSRLSVDEWELLEKKARELAEEIKKADP